MKKIILGALTVATALCLAGCGGAGNSRNIGNNASRVLVGSGKEME